jgi:hypothetical protein
LEPVIVTCAAKHTVGLDPVLGKRLKRKGKGRRELIHAETIKAVGGGQESICKGNGVPGAGLRGWQRGPGWFPQIVFVFE